MREIDPALHLFAGPRPKNLRELQALDFKRIISLESGLYEFCSPDGFLAKQFPCEYGLDQFDMPSGWLTPPDDSAVLKLITLMPDGKKTYLHCQAGVDRTGYVVAAYRMQILHWTFEQALAAWNESGRHWWTWWWEVKLRNWERGIRAT